MTQGHNAISIAGRGFKRLRSPAADARASASRRLFLLFVFAGLALAWAPRAFASPLVVNTLNDPNSSASLCGLRDAINAANTLAAVNGCIAGSGTDTITFTVTGTINVASTLPTVANTLTIDGANITLNGGGSNQVMGNTGTLNLNNITIENGSTEFQGGAISNSGGTLNVNACAFTGNFGCQAGGAIVSGNSGSLDVTNSTFTSNTVMNACSFGNLIGGGAILVASGTANVTGSSFSSNSAGGTGGFLSGGAIALDVGTLTVSNSSFTSNNAGAGGAIFANNNGAAVTSTTVTNSTFTSNSAGFAGAVEGGGLLNSLTISGSTFVSNSAGSGDAGAVYGTGSITNSTFTGNTASAGAAIGSSNTLNVTFCTISGNTASGFGGGGGLFRSGAGALTSTLNILSSNLEGGGVGGDCGFSGGAVTNGGYNIDDDGSCSFGTITGANGKTIGDGVNPLLGPLANNGGPTETEAIGSNSPAYLAVPPADCPIHVDQRGDPRPAPTETDCDIGAYELQPVIGPPPAPGPPPPPTALPTPIAALAPARVAFGSHSMGGVTAPQQVTVTNTSKTPLQVAGVFTSSEAFSETDNCFGTVAAKKSCQINVVFSPTSVGMQNATLAVSDNAGDPIHHPQSVALTGVGSPPAAEVYAVPGALSFAARTSATVSGSQTVTLVNRQNVALKISGISVSGPFTEKSACGATLAAHWSCTIAVTFAPDRVGKDSGVLTISNNATADPLAVVLAGTVPPPAPTPTPKATPTPRAN